MIPSLKARAQNWLTSYQSDADDDIEDVRTTHTLIRDLLSQIEALKRERDEARADAGELEAIKSLVSDRSEVGCYAKVEALEREVAELKKLPGMPNPRQPLTLDGR